MSLFPLLMDLFHLTLIRSSKIDLFNKTILELTELVEDYFSTELLSNTELDFLEGELWETLQHISEINTLSMAPKKICKKLKLDENSCWQLCCAAILDEERPIENKKDRVTYLENLINQYKIKCI